MEHTGCSSCSVAPLPSTVGSAATATSARGPVGPVGCAALVGVPRRFGQPPLALQRMLIKRSVQPAQARTLGRADIVRAQAGPSAGSGGSKRPGHVIDLLSTHTDGRVQCSGPLMVMLLHRGCATNLSANDDAWKLRKMGQAKLWSSACRAQLGKPCLRTSVSTR